MKETNEQNLEDNLEAFENFREILKRKKKYRNNNEVIQAKVIYRWNSESRKEEECLEVTLIRSGVSYGNIGIEDGKKLNSDKVHMDFNPRLQGLQYKYHPDGFLIISGQSAKAGSYRVILIEI